VWLDASRPIHVDSATRFRFVGSHSFSVRSISPELLYLVQGATHIQTCLVLIRIWTISGSLAKHTVDGDYHPSRSLAPHMRTGDTAFYSSQQLQELDH
jgi:hypothetical protein